MKIYRIERMTAEDYNSYLMGSNDFTVETIEVVAETARQAVAMAKWPGFVVNESSVKSLEEIEAEEKARAERKAKAERKEAEKKAKADARVEAKAKAEGMTPEEYKREKRKQATIRRVKIEIANLESELADKKKYLRRLEG